MNDIGIVSGIRYLTTKMGNLGNSYDLLPEIPREKVTKSNGGTNQKIYTSDNVRIRAETHPLEPGIKQQYKDRLIGNMLHHGGIKYEWRNWR